MMEKPPEKPSAEMVKADASALEKPEAEPTPPMPQKAEVEVMSIDGVELTPEQRQKKWEDDQYASWMKDHPKSEIPEAQIEGDPRIAEFNALCDAFEAKHSIEALMAITDLTPADARNHPIREPARLDLPPIVALRKALSDNDEVKARYKRISQAVGMINSGKVDHTRG